VLIGFGVNTYLFALIFLSLPNLVWFLTGVMRKEEEEEDCKKSAEQSMKK
jgi:hypothetical protein